MGVSFGLVIFNKNNKIIDFTSGFKISIYCRKRMVRGGGYGVVASKIS